MIAIAFGTINVVGGFLVTDRMLEMFKAKPEVEARCARGDQGRGGRLVSNLPAATSFLQSESFIYVLYILAFALFIQGLRGLAGADDRRARQPDRRGRHGDRRGRDAAEPGEGNWGLIVLGVALGAAVGDPGGAAT